MTNDDGKAGITAPAPAPAPRPRHPGLGPPWRPGQSGNPGGRPKGVSSKIRELTRDGADILEYLARLVRGEERGARHADRVRGAELLADRLWGRAVETSVQVQLSSEAAGAALPDVSSETLEALARVLPGSAATYPVRTVDALAGEVAVTTMETAEAPGSETRDAGLAPARSAASPAGPSTDDSAPAPGTPG